MPNCDFNFIERGGGGREGLPFHMNSGGTPSYGGSHNGSQCQFLARLASAGPKFVEVNLTNCQREVCRIKFY